MFSSTYRSLKEQVCDPHSRHIPRILKSAFLFGPNASGKSNLIKAIHYAVSVVMNNERPEQRSAQYFKLCTSCAEEPSFFEFVMLIDKEIYRYGFKIKEREIVEEWLYMENSTGEHHVFTRTFNANLKPNNKVTFGERYKRLEEDDFMNFVAKGTPSRGLLLSELVLRNHDEFKHVYAWFKKVVVIYPTSRAFYKEPLLKDEDFFEVYKEIMVKSDLGISEVAFEEVDPDKFLKVLPNKLEPELVAEATGYSIAAYTDKRFFFSEKNGVRKVYSISHRRKMSDSNSLVEFKPSEESDGTNRLFDLIPIMWYVKKDSIVLVDELDRSLHPSLSKHFINLYFNANSERQAQLIATSHNTTLLDVNLIRRDSIWFVKKNFEQASVLYSLAEFNVRNDKALQRAYMSGLYGALPMLD